MSSGTCFITQLTSVAEIRVEMLSFHMIFSSIKIFNRYPTNVANIPVDRFLTILGCGFFQRLTKIGDNESFIVVLGANTLVHHCSVIPSISSILAIIVIAFISSILKAVVHLL